MSKYLSLEEIKQKVETLWVNTAQECYLSQVYYLLTQIFKDGNSFSNLRHTPTPNDAQCISFDVEGLCSNTVITCQIENKIISFLNKGVPILTDGCGLCLYMGVPTTVAFIADYLSTDQYEILEVNQNGESITTRSNSLCQAVTYYLQNFIEKTKTVRKVVISQHHSRLTMEVKGSKLSSNKLQFLIYSDDLSYHHKSMFLLALGGDSASRQKTFQTSKSAIFHHVWQ